MYHLYGITTISFPMLGCGNGELDWETQVQPLMEEYLRQLPITAFIHLQNRRDAFVPEHNDTKATREWLRGEPESLAFAEVWDELGKLPSGPTQFAKLDTGEPFGVEVDREAEVLTIYPSGEIRDIPKDALLDLWQQIRQSGFVSGNDLPCGLDNFAEYIIPVISKLPYVELVVMADQYRDVTQQSVGLRLSPRLRGTELPLFAVSDAVELV